MVMNILVKNLLFLYSFVSCFGCNGSSQYTVSILGTGYVGLVTGTCITDMHKNDEVRVYCLDIDSYKIANLKKGIIPIYEPGLSELVQKNIARNMLFFSDDIAETISRSNIIFLAVGTPTASDGSVDTSYFYNALEQVVKNISRNPTTLVLKSTLPIGTGKKVTGYIKQHADPSITLHIVSNPEFLREGTAIKDTMNADRIIIGSNASQDLQDIQQLYSPLIKKNIPILYTDLTTAETIKYASNSFLALKLSYINEIANLCDKTGANIQQVAKGIGLDKRIGFSFLQPGPGFGGSCLPKDTLGLLATAKQWGISLNTVEAAVATNEYQKLMPYRKLKKYIPGKSLCNTTIAILGLSFKANTDDIRYSAAIPLIKKLQEKKAHIQVFDPQAMEHMKRIFPNITYCDTSYKAIENADAVIVLTEWDEFKNLDFSKVKQLMRDAIIIDSRNLLSIATLRTLGFAYNGIGIS